MLQEADGCVEQETASPEPVAQADAHGNTCRETGNSGCRSLSLIFNTQLRMYSPTAKYCAPGSLVQSLRHHRLSSLKGQACFINQTSFFPHLPPSPGLSLHCDIKQISCKAAAGTDMLWNKSHIVQGWSPSLLPAPLQHPPQGLQHFHPQYAIPKRETENNPTNSDWHFS